MEVWLFLACCAANIILSKLDFPFENVDILPN